MTSVFGLSCLIVVVFGVSMTDAYTNRYDGFDIDSVLKSERMYKSYLNCFLDLGPCNPMSEEGKRLIPEIINTSCAKCSPHQKYLICKVFKLILEQKPDDLQKLLAKYDPENKHYQDLIKFIKDNENNTLGYN
uniref:Ejaculatory bulb-specific protein 3 n=2 Tax=Cacopsylla melanoneura TaxID=428564 RepID=A0A8D9EW37_9HEMI